MSASRARVGRGGECAAESGSVPGAPYASAVPAPAAETRTGLVRRARKIDRVLGETYPDAKCELDFDDPFQLLVVTVLSAQTTDKRVNAVRPTLFAAYPDPKAMAAADRATLEGDHRPAGVLPGQDRVAAQAERRAGRRPRRPGAAPPRRPRQAARRRPQDRQRRARQRLRHPGHHRRHPLRPPRAPLRLDRGDRPGQGRARRRRPLREARLDDAQPPPDLARSPRSATRRSPRAVRAPSRSGARRTARARPTPRPRPSW